MAEDQIWLHWLAKQWIISGLLALVGIGLAVGSVRDLRSKSMRQLDARFPAITIFTAIAGLLIGGVGLAGVTFTLLNLNQIF